MAGAQPSPRRKGGKASPGLATALLLDAFQVDDVYFGGSRLAQALNETAEKSTDLRVAIDTIQRLTEFVRKLRSIESELHTHAAALMGKDKEIDLGVEVGVVERTTTQTTKWDHDALFSKITSLAPDAVNPETGQIVPDGSKLAEVLKGCVAPSYWRKGKLKEQGIDPNEYSETTYGAKRVRIRSQEGRNAVHSTSSQAGGQAGRSSRRDSGGTNLPASTGDQAVSGEPEA